MKVGNILLGVNRCTLAWCWYTDLRDNAASAYHTTFTDANARQDNSAAAKPAVFPDGNGFAELRTIRSIANHWIQWVCPTEQGAIRTKECSRANLDGTSVYYCCVEVKEDILAKLDIVAVVYVDRLFDPGFVGEQVIIFFGSACFRWKGGLVVDDASRWSASETHTTPPSIFTYLLPPHLDSFSPCRFYRPVESLASMPTALTLCDNLWNKGMEQLAGLHSPPRFR